MQNLSCTTQWLRRGPSSAFEPHFGIRYGCVPVLFCSVLFCSVLFCSVLAALLVSSDSFSCFVVCDFEQGEANADQKIKVNGSEIDMTKYYSIMYQTMIADWRDRKGMGDFAFMTVQLPPSESYASAPNTADPTGRSRIRLAEAACSPHPDGLTDISGVAVSLDCGGKSAWGWDHPPNKNEISRRLALQTVHAAYAQQGRIPRGAACSPGDLEASCSDSLWTGPVVQTASLEGVTLTITFDPVTAVGLKLVDTKSTNPDGSTNNCTRCCVGAPPFEVGAGGKWTRLPLSAVKTMGTTGLMLHLPGNLSMPDHVRYAWSDFVDCTLQNNDSLPAGPFVLDVVSEKLSSGDQTGDFSTYDLAPIASTSTSLATKDKDIEKAAADPELPEDVLSPPMG
eukprot:SAG31_NODE_770_length_12217_cov_2.855174_11_plen_395_part_00